jgi:hypothetical protein
MGQNGTLYGLDPGTGTARQRASIGVPANHFPTPSVGDGLLLAPAADQVVAFAASGVGSSGSGPPSKTPGGTSNSAPSTTVAAAPATAGGGGIPPVGVIGIVLGGAAVIAAVGWLGWIHRRRTRAQGGP